MNRPIKYLNMHQAPFVPAVGNLKNTFEPTNMTGLKMLYTSDGVIVDYKGVSFVIPLANVVTAVFSEPNQTLAAVA